MVMSGYEWLRMVTGSHGWLRVVKGGHKWLRVVTGVTGFTGIMGSYEWGRGQWHQDLFIYWTQWSNDLYDLSIQNEWSNIRATFILRWSCLHRHKHFWRLSLNPWIQISNIIHSCSNFAKAFISMQAIQPLNHGIRPGPANLPCLKVNDQKGFSSDQTRRPTAI